MQNFGFALGRKLVFLKQLGDSLWILGLTSLAGSLGRRELWGAQGIGTGASVEPLSSTPDCLFPKCLPITSWFGGLRAQSLLRLSPAPGGRWSWAGLEQCLYDGKFFGSVLGLQGSWARPGYPGVVSAAAGPSSADFLSLWVSCSFPAGPRSRSPVPKLLQMWSPAAGRTKRNWDLATGFFCGIGMHRRLGD